LAREKEMSSIFGQYFDVLMDKFNFLPINIGLGLSQQDTQGNFTLKLGQFEYSNSIWLLIFLCWSSIMLQLLEVQQSKNIQGEITIGSGNDVYFLFFISLFNLILWAMVIMTIINYFLVIFKVVYYWRSNH
ncbi:MAG: CDP-alcohol phosphatidyltransferase family protein, partial [Candidatus Hodarchaeota archaeon]